MKVVISKKKRNLTLYNKEEKIILVCKIALGKNAIGHKEKEGDGKTPEGQYKICLVKEKGKYGKSLGLNYPNIKDATNAYFNNWIDDFTYNAITSAINKGSRPPWGTALGGEIYIHAGGNEKDWTQGCIALNETDMEMLYNCYQQINLEEIQP